MQRENRFPDQIFLKNVVPIRDKEVFALVSSTEMESMIFSPKANAKDDIEKYKSCTKEWVTRSKHYRIIGDFSNFGHHFVTQGCTESLDMFYRNNEGRRFRVLRGEYPYTRDVIQLRGRPFAFFTSPEHLERNDAVIISHPFSATGNAIPSKFLEDVLTTCDRLDVPVMLDLAFFGIAYDMPLLSFDYDCIKVIAFSFSKVFCLENVRIGFCFSKINDIFLKNLHENNYVNRFGCLLTTKLMETFEPDHFCDKYRPVQEKICRENFLKPSNVISVGIGDVYWNAFKRHDIANRVCIAPLLN